jgi:hypothetical protein
MSLAIILGTVGIFSIVCLLGFLGLRRSYRKYCAEMDRKDELRNECLRNEKNVKILVKRFNDSYGNGSPGTISFNVRMKVGFSLSTIGTMPLEDQAREYDLLYKMLYETWNRTNANPEDVAAITSPLSNFCRELAGRKMKLIRKLAEEEN